MPSEVYTFANWEAGIDPPEGWDVADALRDGWTPEQITTYLRHCAVPWEPPADEPRRDPASVRDAPSVRDPAPEPPADPLPEPPDMGPEPPPFEPPFEPPHDAPPAMGAPEPPDIPLPAEPDRGSPAEIERDPDPRPEPVAVPEPSDMLDPREPLKSARNLVEVSYKLGGQRTLHHHRGVFYRWNGSCYEDEDQNAVRSVVWKFLDKGWRYGPNKHPVRFQPTNAKSNDVLAALTAACNLHARIEAPSWLSGGDDLPPASEFLALQNGLLHLPREELYPPTPTYFGLSAAGVDYKPDAPEPAEWLRFLGELWGDDRQAVDTLQDLFGYLLSTDTSQQKIALLVGPKRSGKGTIARVMSALFGRDSVASPTLTSLEGDFGLASLIGKPVAIIGDARLSGRANQSVIAERLLSISGEDRIEVNRKFLAPWVGRLPTRFVIMTNELPRLADASGALASRFVVLTMERSFYGQEDRGLFGRLALEMPGILNWAIEGYHRLRQRGHFLQPDSARDAIDELEALGSPIGAFIKESCIIAPGAREGVSALFEHWRKWCEENGRREAGTVQSFGRDIRAAVPGLRIKSQGHGGSGGRCYEGIKHDPLRAKISAGTGDTDAPPISNIPF